MPFSILLLTSASSERHITGAKSDRVSMEQNLRPGELALFFDKVDEGPARSALGMSDLNCCDGIIFYKNNDAQNVVCLVEMKHTNLEKAKKQIMNTYDRLNSLLKQECASCRNYFQQIIWQAYIYRSGSAPKSGFRDYETSLKAYGFKDAWVRGDRDISKYLRMEMDFVKSKKQKVKI